MTTVRSYLLPSKCDGEDMGSSAVVIDVLRASTTICAALENGASAIRPFAEIESARNYADQQDILLGGERNGEKVSGFDFGNSPLEYVPSRVQNHEIAFTTTNGTRAMEKCRGAARVVIGAFCNRRSVVNYFREDDRLDLICAGTDGRIAIEDCAFAGALIDQLAEGREQDFGESERFCIQCWREFEQTGVEYLRSGAGGQNLLRLGRGEDIEFASKLDTLDIVPLLRNDSWKIEPA